MEILNNQILLILGIAIILFFALREVYCWYWKINKRIELQEETNLLLQKLIDQNQKPEINSYEQTEPIEITDVNDPKVMDALLNKLNNSKK